jgi:hypothetical protein
MLTAQAARMVNPHESPDDYGRLSDADLLEAYERSGGTPGDEHADALVAEIHRRELDV